MKGRETKTNPFNSTVSVHEHEDDTVSGLWLQGGGVSGILGFFTFYFHVVITHPSLLSPLKHVVGPLWTAASFTVDEASSASREGATAASSTGVHPGFLAITVVVLKGEKSKSFSQMLLLIQPIELNSESTTS